MHATPLPMPGLDESVDEYVARTGGYAARVRLTFHDGRVVEVPGRGDLASLAYSFHSGRCDDSFTAFAIDRPWFEFRIGDVARVELFPADADWASRVLRALGEVD
jgi:hypothetical protein